MVWIGGVNSTYARVAFNFIATAVFALLALVAKACYESWIKRRLLQGRDLSIVHAIGWLRGSSVFTAWRKTGRVPGRRWYVIMLFITIGGYTTHQLNAAIVAWPSITQCIFNAGLVLNSKQLILENPSWNTMSLGYTQASQMHAGCASGILNKVPNNDTEVPCPQTPDIAPDGKRSDVLGTWVCDSSATRTWDGIVSAPTPIADASIDAGLLYHGWHAQRWHSTVGGQDVYSQIVIWSASTDGVNETSKSWDIKFGIEQDSSQASEAPEYRYFGCSLHKAATSDPNGTLDKIMSAINTTYILTEWVTILPMNFYSGKDSPARSDVGLQMAYLLNSMFMISGAGDYMTSTVTSDQDQFYGCNGIGTEIPNYVLAALGSVIALILLFTLWWMVLEVQIIMLTRKKGKARLRLLPTDQCDWAAWASYHSDKAAALATVIHNGALNADENAAEHDSMFIGQGEDRKLSERAWTRRQLRGRRMRLQGEQIVLYKESSAQHPMYGMVTYTAQPNKRH